MIPGLCVTGYHQHLFILDMQVGYVSIQKLLYLGKWLYTHTVKAQGKEEEALKKVENQPLSNYWDILLRNKCITPSLESLNQKLPLGSTLIAFLVLWSLWSCSVTYIEFPHSPVGTCILVSLFYLCPCKAFLHWRFWCWLGLSRILGL